MTAKQSLMVDAEISAVEMLARDHARMRLAGGNLAEAAIRVIHDYDGLHRLSLAVAGWAEAIAAEGDRGPQTMRPHFSAQPTAEGNETMTELKPCPFCGSKLRIFGKADDDNQAAQHPLSDCVASLAIISRDKWPAWNTRIQDNPHDQ